MVNSLTTLISRGPEAVYDAYVEFINWLEEQGCSLDQIAAIRLALTQRSMEDAIDYLKDQWARADAIVKSNVGAMRSEAEDIKKGIEQGISDIVNTGEVVVGEIIESAEDVREKVEEEVEELIDNVGEASEDIVNAILGWLD